jgi:hypothetical protein
VSEEIYFLSIIIMFCAIVVDSFITHYGLRRLQRLPLAFFRQRKALKLTGGEDVRAKTT